MKYVTIKDIANELGISKSTVSRALSGDSHNVSKETVRKVIETAEEMGYRKNEMAVNLRHRSSKTIGIVVPESVTSFYMQFTSKVQKLLQLQGYRVILALSDEDFLTERSNFEMFDKYRVDGILISSCHNKANLEFYNSFIKRGIPLVFFDRTVSGLDCSNVRSDDYRSAFFLMEHLIYNGYKRILHLAGPDYIRNTEERLRAYCDTLKKHGIPYDPDLVIRTGVNEEDGEAAMNNFLSSAPPSGKCDALFCFTEMQALGAKRVLQQHGIRIPEEIAIVCMSGTRLSTLVHPAITAVEQPVEQMADEAVRLLLNKIEDHASPSENIVLPAKMIIRESSQD